MHVVGGSELCRKSPASGVRRPGKNPSSASYNEFPHFRMGTEPQASTHSAQGAQYIRPRHRGCRARGSFHCSQDIARMPSREQGATLALKSVFLLPDPGPALQPNTQGQRREPSHITWPGSPATSSTSSKEEAGTCP